ncbi:uncharacterized protein LAJ45_08738 [Morchella importuna]|uniref:uncharacterized protein n=1 Tax=Morchella importuna TaxID=1174673 RepID=UPI001E8ED27C|nr:uncharacterized protein LAJ45_08738 [Morchella importuna]KAH8147260.1 hypothetical protein LAJ45_08738 [Morchella importuna]
MIPPSPVMDRRHNINFERPDFEIMLQKSGTNLCDLEIVMRGSSRGVEVVRIGVEYMFDISRSSKCKIQVSTCVSYSTLE